MTQLTLYILTDANRKYLEIGITTQLQQTIYEVGEQNKRAFSAFGNLNRMVYQQSFDNEFEANKALSTLKMYTRMQLERLIRKSNPNWLDLGTKYHVKETKKVVAYA